MTWRTWAATAFQMASPCHRTSLGTSMKIWGCRSVSVWHMSLTLLTSSRPSISPHGFSSKPWFILFCAYYLVQIGHKRTCWSAWINDESWSVEKKADHIKEGSQPAVAATINPKSFDHLLCQIFSPVSLSLSLEYFSMWLLGRHTLLIFLPLLRSFLSVFSGAYSSFS